MCSDPLADQSPFKVRSARRGFRKGVDPLKLDQLVDELDVGALRPPEFVRLRREPSRESLPAKDDRESD